MSEDAISRQAVLDIINFEDKWLLDAKGHNANTEIAFGGMRSKVSALPPVTPKQRTGHWLMPDKEYSSKIWRKCSCCGTHIEKYSKYISFDGEVHYIPYRLNYCPVCGARMVKSQESCDTCKHKDEEWDSEPCDGCCGNHSGFEPQESEDDLK